MTDRVLIARDCLDQEYILNTMLITARHIRATDMDVNSNTDGNNSNDINEMHSH